MNNLKEISKLRYEEPNPLQNPKLLAKIRLVEDLVVYEARQYQY